MSFEGDEFVDKGKKGLKGGTAVRLNQSALNNLCDKIQDPPSIPRRPKTARR